MAFALMNRGRKLLRRFEDSTTKRSYIAVYGIVFLIFFIAMSFSFISAGKGFIWVVDGLEQQYPFFVAEGEWLRQVLYSIFIQHSFTIPVWSTEVGYGGDMLLTLLPCIGDPVNLISVFVPVEYADLALNATVPIHLFLAGLFFSLYCLYKGNDRFSTLVGSMVYVFSGFAMLAFSQIFMLSLLVYAPLVLWGIDKVFRRESPILFIVSLALCFILAVAYAYVVCLLLLVYCIIRYCFLDEKKDIAHFFRWAGKIAGFVLISVLIGAFIVIPQVVSLLSQSRIGLVRPDMLFYNPQYYVTLIRGFISVGDIGSDCLYGFASIALIALLALFAQKSKNDPRRRSKAIVKIMFVVMTVFLCFPLFGKLFNGFAYPNNRWVWAYILLVAYLTVMMLPELHRLGRREKRIVVAVSLAYAALVCIVFLPFAFVPTMFGCVVLFAILYLLFSDEDRSGSFTRKTGVLVSVLVSVFVSFAFFGSPLIDKGVNMAVSRVGLGRSYDLTVKNNPASMVAEMKGRNDSSSYDGTGFKLYRNSNMVQGLNAPLFYDSFYNDNIDTYHTGLGLVTSPINFSYSGLNSRTPLEALAGVEYFVAPEDKDALLPPLFTKKEAEGTYDGESYAVYSTDYYLPTAFFYQTSISISDYNDMTPMQKQQALLQGVVLDQGDNSLDKTKVVFEDKPIPYDIVPKIDKNDTRRLSYQELFEKQGVKIEGSKITVLHPGTTVVLQAKIPAGTEASLYVGNFKYTDIPPSLQFTEDEQNGLSLYTKQIMAFNDIFGQSINSDPKINVTLGAITQEIWNPASSGALYGGKNSWLVNLGYSDSSREDVELSFPTAGVYDIGDLQISAQPVDSYASQIERLKKTSTDIHDLTFSGSRLSCTADVGDDSKFLYFRIPFSTGWKASVDGQPVNLVKANMGFMGVGLDEGQHKVELRYETPGLLAGSLVSVVGLVALAGVVIMRKSFHVRITREHS